MATYQDTYPNGPAIGLAGQIANEELSNRISREVETAAGIAFGQPVQRGADDHGVVLQAAGTFIGIAILDPAVPPNADKPDAYPHRFTGAFMTKGVMHVIAGENVADGEAVHWNPANGRYVSTAGGGNIAIPGAVFDSTGVDGDLVLLALNLR